MKLMQLAAITAALSLSGLATASAATLAFDFDEANSSVSVTSSTPLCFPINGCKLSVDLADPFPSTILNEGDSITFDFANWTVGQGVGMDFDARVFAKLAFITPQAPNATTGGTATYITAGGLFTGGSLIWDNPFQTLTANDGSIFTVAFNNVGGLTAGRNATSSVTVGLTSSNAVPEPSAWALMILGFGLTGATLRTRKLAAARI